MVNLVGGNQCCEDQSPSTQLKSDIKIVKYLCKYNWYYGSVSHILENHAIIHENHPLLVFVNCDLLNGECVTGSQLRELLSRLNNKYKILVSEKGEAAKRRDFSTWGEYRFFYLSKLAWEDDKESDVERAKMTWVPDEDSRVHEEEVDDMGSVRLSLFTRLLGFVKNIIFCCASL